MIIYLKNKHTLKLIISILIASIGKKGLTTKKMKEIKKHPLEL